MCKQDDEADEAGTTYNSSPRAMLPSDAQPLSVKGRARYGPSDSTDNLQASVASQVCCPLASCDPQASGALFQLLAAPLLLCCVALLFLLLLCLAPGCKLMQNDNQP